MKKSRLNEAQIIGVLREQEAGSLTAEVCHRHEISEQTFYCWPRLAPSSRAGASTTTTPGRTRRTGTDSGGGAPEPRGRSAAQHDQRRRTAAPAGDADRLSTPWALIMIEGPEGARQAGSANRPAPSTSGFFSGRCQKALTPKRSPSPQEWREPPRRAGCVVRRRFWPQAGRC